MKLLVVAPLKEAILLLGSPVKTSTKAVYISNELLHWLSESVMCSERMLHVSASENFLCKLLHHEREQRTYPLNYPSWRKGVRLSKVII